MTYGLKDSSGKAFIQAIKDLFRLSFKNFDWFDHPAEVKHYLI